MSQLFTTLPWEEKPTRKPCWKKLKLSQLFTGTQGYIQHGHHSPACLIAEAIDLEFCNNVNS